MRHHTTTDPKCRKCGEPLRENKQHVRSCRNGCDIYTAVVTGSPMDEPDIYSGDGYYRTLPTNKEER